MSNVKNMSFMFSNCSSLISTPDLSKWTINKEDNISMNNMFNGCISLAYLPNLENWNFEYLPDTRFIFESCISILSLPEITSKYNFEEKDNEIPMELFNLFFHKNKNLG